MEIKLLTRKDNITKLLQYIIGIILLISIIGKSINMKPTLIFLSFLSNDFIDNRYIFSLIIFLEIILCISVLLGLFPRLTFKIIPIVFFIYSLAVFYSILQGINTDCGCFGNLIESPIGLATLFRNIFLFIISIVISVNYKHVYTFEKFIYKK